MGPRWIKACLDSHLKSPIESRTLNGRVRQMVELMGPWRRRRLEDVPPVGG
jgi:hypothetical protein